MTARPYSKHRLILNESEFEYLQHMLDFGSTMEQALLEIRPDLNDEPWQYEDMVVTVHRRRELST